MHLNFTFLKAKIRTQNLITLYKHKNFYFEFPGQLALH